ncbi:MAG: 1-acyl-sn-glycerol-3-phosphate acyltransferase [Phycisphaerales bacterium]|nr:MAG: 1-acyl-sn-glycerol-3-phosphate acyltransferase [Phycisphaerales bacterium]
MLGSAIHWVLLCGLNVICVAYAVLLTFIFELYFACFLPLFLVLGKGRLDDALRYHNGYYGAFMVCLFRPIIRVRRRGMEHLPTRGPVMMVTNHRSLFDIFFFGLTQQPNVAVLVRSWPFRLPVLGRFMRGAGYIDIERLSFDKTSELIRQLSSRRVSALCFVEGHRSRDGRLQRFRSGAFRLAVECYLPVLPVCVTGSEQLCAPGSRLIRPASIDFLILSPVETASFPAEKRALKVRRHVENIFREQLGE